MQQEERQRRERARDAMHNARAHVLTLIMEVGLASLTPRAKRAIRNACRELTLVYDLSQEELDDFRDDLSDLLWLTGDDR